jgi:hypothetical protein
MASPGKRFINLEVPEDHYLILKRVAASEGQRSVASLVRMAVADFIRRLPSAPIAPPSRLHLVEIPDYAATQEMPSVPLSQPTSWIPAHPEAREITEPEEPNEANAKPGEVE